MQTSAEAEAKQADIRSKHLQKQLAEQQKSLHGMEKEAVKLQKDLANEEAAVQACQSRCILYHALSQAADGLALVNTVSWSVLYGVCS